MSKGVAHRDAVVRYTVGLNHPFCFDNVNLWVRCIKLSWYVNTIHQSYLSLVIPHKGDAEQMLAMKLVEFLTRNSAALYKVGLFPPSQYHNPTCRPSEEALTITLSLVKPHNTAKGEAPQRAIAGLLKLCRSSHSNAISVEHYYEVRRQGKWVQEFADLDVQLGALRSTIDLGTTQ